MNAETGIRALRGHWRHFDYFSLGKLSREKIAKTAHMSPKCPKSLQEATISTPDLTMNTRSTTTSPVLPTTQGDPPGLVKILLSQAASDALAAVGPCLCHSQFAPYPSPPSAQGRQVLICFPVSWKMLNDIALLIEGKARVVKIKPAKTCPTC